MKSNTPKLYIVKDHLGLYLYKGKPTRLLGSVWNKGDKSKMIAKLDDDFTEFTDLSIKDKPVEVELKIKEK